MINLCCACSLGKALYSLAVPLPSDSTPPSISTRACTQCLYPVLTLLRVKIDKLSVKHSGTVRRTNIPCKGSNNTLIRLMLQIPVLPFFVSFCRLCCFIANYQKIHTHPKPTMNSPPSLKASPNTPSPARPSLSRQSSVSSKRLSTRVMFGEEHCYVIDAKGYGNCGRYLNVRIIASLS